MTVRFSCPACGASLAVADNLAGRKGKCKKCGADVVAPLAASPTDQTAEPKNQTCAQCGKTIPNKQVVKTQGQVLCRRCFDEGRTAPTPILLNCPACYRQVEVPYENRRRENVCPHCKEVIQLAGFQLLWPEIKFRLSVIRAKRELYRQERRKRKQEKAEAEANRETFEFADPTAASQPSFSRTGYKIGHTAAQPTTSHKPTNQSPGQGWAACVVILCIILALVFGYAFMLASRSRDKAAQSLVDIVVGRYTCSDGSGCIEIVDCGMTGDGASLNGMLKITMYFERMDVVPGSNADVPVEYSDLFIIESASINLLVGVYRAHAQSDHPGVIEILPSNRIRVVNGRESIIFAKQ